MELNDFLSQSGIITHDKAAARLLNQFGLDWTVATEPLFTKNPETGALENSDFQAIVRQDNRKHFATCKDGYQVFQNSELLELVNRSAEETGLKLTNGGSFKGGARVYLQLRNSDLTGIGENNDTIKRYITGINGHDGSTALRWGLTNITISCSNTFWSAYRNMEHSAKHTRSLRDRVRDITQEIQAIQEEEEVLYNKIFKLADAPIEEKHYNSTVKTVLGIDLDRKPTRAELTGYQWNRLVDLKNSIVAETQEKGHTLWGLFSGVTRYSTHLAPGKAERREESKAIGQMYVKDNKVFNDLVKVIS